MKIRTSGAEVGRIVTVRLDDYTEEIAIGDYVKSSGRIYEVVRVHRVRSGKTAGRYELRGRVAAAVPEGVTTHRMEWRRGEYTSGGFAAHAVP